ncbi:hypothetical protein HPP92_014159 [Vanilla planifolia]|uniref:Prolamin-like domain-containing protein n=1 Tax=Vanilla planifolia TaxID=51239 RepID=A0A835USV8_VANPL|nr:hypothetical protein HPP92_014590 [Vanilla planifolia]KAG0474473.1 hypothetical protein HPP92_014159 [Vanilla planifolia]
MKATAGLLTMFLLLLGLAAAVAPPAEAPQPVAGSSPRIWRKPSPGILPAPILRDPELRECWTHLRRPPGCVSDIYQSSEKGFISLKQDCCKAVRALSDRCFQRIFTSIPFKPGFTEEVKVFCASAF